MPPPGPITGGVLAQIAQFLVQNTPVSVSSAGDTDIASPRPFIHLFQRINVAAGSYTRNFTINSANALTDSIIEMDFSIAAGTDATLILPIYSLNTSNPPTIEQLRGRAEASYYNLRARFNGTNWEKLTGAYQ